MEAPEEVTTHIVKGKRTKRQRVQSPIPLGLPADSSSGDGGGDDCIINGKMINCTSSSSPTTSNNNNNNNNEFQDSTEEEEDMANCLILLAKGHAAITTTNNNKFQKHDHYSTTKFNSRRFLETAASTGSGTVGYYVYECKTCNRTFPSFQALGGHRASHKKPKAIHHNDDKKNLMTLSSDEEGHGYSKNVSSLSLLLSENHKHINNRAGAALHSNNHQNTSKGKIHECSICGAEFASGQALGGHMRRHRGPLVATSTTTTTLSLTPMASRPPPQIESDEESKTNKARNLLSLDLDLNLPAPEQDDNKCPFGSKQPQQQLQQQQEEEESPIVFSTPALVDCHY